MTMFFPLGDFGSVFAPDNASCVAMAVSAARAQLVIFLLAIAAVFTIPLRAHAVPQWPTGDLADVLFVSDAEAESRWVDFNLMPRLALREEWYHPSPTRLVQSERTPPEALGDGPTIMPPPFDPTADGIGDNDQPTQPEENGGIVTEVPDEPPADDEPSADDEAPVVPDLAGGILILSNDGDLTFKPGVRIQPRYMYDTGNGNNDFLIRRFRLKGGGSLFDLGKYGVELKIDNEGRFAATPNARAENAWLDFPLVDDLMFLRAGLTDLPFSRDALTSDSKLLFMDRTLIKEQLTFVGMADNTFGLLLHGRPHKGHFEYCFGIFDNDQYERFGLVGQRESDQLMPAGRVVVSLLDPLPSLDGYADYQESYIGQGQRLELGANAAHLGDAVDGLVTQDITAWGVDLFANNGPYTFQTEYDRIYEDLSTGAELESDGWYAQAGYILNPCDPCTEFVVRYETLDPFIGEQLDWYRVGFNFYIREHNLKIQTDYCFRSGNTLTAPLPGGLGLFDEDVFEVQLQLDF